MATQIGPTRIHIERKSLEDIYKSLQCFRCFDIPSITKERWNRYSCIKNSHQLCEKCKTKCECGSAVVDYPNPSIHEILKDLPTYCANFNAGCREIFMQSKDLEAHQQSCVFREVYCPGCYDCVVFKVSQKRWNTLYCKLNTTALQFLTYCLSYFIVNNVMRCLNV